MKAIKINNKDYVIKFTAGVIKELNTKGITLMQLINDLQEMKVDNMYTTFAAGLKSMQRDIDEAKALEILDDYFSESDDNDLETLFITLIEELSSAMGLRKKFKTVIEDIKKTVQE